MKKLINLAPFRLGAKRRGWKFSKRHPRKGAEDMNDIIPMGEDKRKVLRLKSRVSGRSK